MELMKRWRMWSEEQHENWGEHLQKRYNTFRDFKTPLWYRTLTDGIWGQIDLGTKLFLNQLVIDTMKKFDEKFAKELIEKAVNKLKLNSGR